MIDYSSSRITCRSIVEALRATPGRNDKIDILKSALKHPDFINVCKLTYDTYKNYYIRSIDALRKDVDFKISRTGYRHISHAYTMLNNINENGSANAILKRQLAYKLEELHEDDIWVYDLILKRGLDCGITSSSINKALPGTIPEFKVMLCQKFNTKTMQNIIYPAIAQVKMDGMRVLAFVKGGKVTIRSRSGKTLTTHGALDQSLSVFADGGNCVLDGELLVLKKNSQEYECRKTGNGICNKAVRGTITEEDANRLVFVAWDVISEDSFWAQSGSIPYKTRFTVLSERIQTLSFNSAFVSKLVLVKGIQVDDYYEVQKYYEMQLADGQEGIILKNSDSVYEGKRSKNNIKFKVENTADLIIEEVVEGAGKYSGQLGSFRCTTSDGILSVNVGSGFTDSNRTEYFTNEMVGQIVEVKYNEIINDKFDNKSLFLPIFVEIRSDKDIANSMGELK